MVGLPNPTPGPYHQVRGLPMTSVLQFSSDVRQSDNLHKARRATTPGVPWSVVGLLQILQVAQVHADLQR